MNPEALFAVALGISPPWKVVGVEFSQENKRLDIRIDFPRGAQFACPVCGTAAPVHDTTEKAWRHLSFFQYETYLTARVPRTKCPNQDCGVKQVAAPWVRAGSGFTLLFEALVMALARQMAVNAIAQLLQAHDTRLWRIICSYVESARDAEDFSGVTRLGADETSARRGHDYVTFFFDMDARKLLFGAHGKDHTTVERFVADLEAHGGSTENITDACIDMSKSFIKGLQDNFPKAVLTFDQFHVIKMMNDVLGKISAEEARQFPEELRKTRYLFLKNPDRLTKEQEQRLRSLTRFDLGSIKAYILKLGLQFVYFVENRQEAEILLKRWYRRAVRSKVDRIVKLAKAIKEHWRGILSYFDSRLTNGFLEGINSLIQVAKAKARGYRNPNNLIAMAYLIAGKLKFPQPT
ncbi:transposase [Geothermobacter ehrlichii]|uniref:Transposase n=1 Tax=Geothermobacter ehrlichii TaxID=213224 RepID=A0A5D3WLH2_9BACT|nr:ISL3 family transposase [Geothermobacter ehrlichii]TYO98353.1 transposase [Geothermobacter ehrlichii]TYO98355.1 transposase [Geothermobacter ehrlichii]